MFLIRFPVFRVFLWSVVIAKKAEMPTKLRIICYHWVT